VSRALSMLISCLAIAGLVQPASATATASRDGRAKLASGIALGQGSAVAESAQGSPPSPGSAGSGSPSGTNASVACKRLAAKHIRCTMTIKRGSGVSGAVRTRIYRGKLLVALGQGRVSGGNATVIMELLHRMTPGRYTVKMVVTVNATSVLRLH